MNRPNMQTLAPDVPADLHLLDAHAVVELLRNGLVSPDQLLDVVEKRLAAVEHLVHAVPITCLERARAAAKKLKHPVAPPRGYLYGLPVLIKDTEAVSGVRFTEGYKPFGDRIAPSSGPVARQLEARGAIIVGKTNVPEFAAGSQCFNSLFPTTLSPWDTRTTAGGSSGGSAAALASCECWLASGSDLGGSLRTPAAFCGVVGFRVSPGVVPRDGAIPSGPLLGLHAVGGPMGRCVRDVGLFLDAMSGSAGWDFAPCAQEEAWEVVAIRGARTRGTSRRVAFSDFGLHVNPEVAALCRRSAELLAGEGPGNGAVRDLCAADLDVSLAERLFMVLRAEKFANNFGPLLEFDDFAGALKPEIHWNTNVGRVPEAAAMAASARERLSTLAEQVELLFQDVDVLVTPATLDGAFDAEVRYPTEQESFTNYLSWMVPAFVVTMMNCPAIVLPCGFLADGRPVGVQLVGPPGGDAAVLGAAAALEVSLELPRACPVPRSGSVSLCTVGPRTAVDAAKHHDGEVLRFVERYAPTTPSVD